MRADDHCRAPKMTQEMRGKQSDIKQHHVYYSILAVKHSVTTFNHVSLPAIRRPKMPLFMFRCELCRRILYVTNYIHFILFIIFQVRDLQNKASVTSMTSRRPSSALNQGNHIYQINTHFLFAARFKPRISFFILASTILYRPLTPLGRPATPLLVPPATTTFT